MLSLGVTKQIKLKENAHFFREARALFAVSSWIARVTSKLLESPVEAADVVRATICGLGVR